MAEEEEEDVDVQALLASINANFEPSNIQSEQEISHDLQLNSQENTDLDGIRDITIVRQNAELLAQEYDPIQEIINQLEVQHSLLTDKTIQEHQLDTSQIQSIVGIVKKNFDLKQEVIYKNQKYLLNKINDIRNSTNKLLSIQQTKEYTLTKVKSSEVISKFKDLRNLDIQVFKTKGYVLTMIERLEIIESSVDKIMDYHVKKKMKQMELLANKQQQS